MNTISLQQIKKEAKRLIKLAKEGDFSSENGLRILSLSDAQEVMARLKGYPNWHALITSSEAAPIDSQHDPEEKVWTESDLLRIKNLLKLRYRENIEFSFNHAESIDKHLEYKIGESVPSRTKNLGADSSPLLSRLIDRHEVVNIPMQGNVLIQGTVKSGGMLTMVNLVEDHARHNQPVVIIDPNFDPSLLWRLKDSYPDRHLRAVVFQRGKTPQTSSIDPFEFFCRGSLSNLLIDQDSDQSPENGQWIERAKLLLIGIEDSLIAWRSKEPGLVIDIEFLRGLCSIQGLISLQLSFPSNTLRKFLNDIPGLFITEQNAVIKEVKTYPQVDIILYVFMQLTRMMDALEELYSNGVFSATPSLTWDEIMLEAATTVFFLNAGVGLSSDVTDETRKRNYWIISIVLRQYLSNRMEKMKQQVGFEYPSTLICFRDPDKKTISLLVPVLTQARSLNMKSIILTNEIFPSIQQLTLWGNSRTKIILEQDLKGAEWIVDELFSGANPARRHKLVQDMMKLNPGDAFLISDNLTTAVKIRFPELGFNQSDLSLTPGVSKYRMV